MAVETDFYFFLINHEKVGVKCFRRSYLLCLTLTNIQRFHSTLANFNLSNQNILTQPILSGCEYGEKINRGKKV